MPHCKPESLVAGGNRHMSWFDCRVCDHRIVDIPTGKNPMYYEVPPCAASPNYDPLQPKVTPETLKLSKVPPLCKAEQKFREVKEAPAYTIDEEQILAAARKILKEKEAGSSSSGDTPTAFKSSAPHPPPVPAKRPPPQPRFPMPETQGIKRETREEDMEYVTEIDIALMEEINALEGRAAQLRMNLGSKAPARR